jgi:3-oxoacyl-[acyl-carrier protein] reductase
MVPHADLEALDDDLIGAVLTANVRGPFTTIRAFAPVLRTSGNGVIINISSRAAARGGSSSIIYGASKAALDTMSMALARVLAPESSQPSIGSSSRARRGRFTALGCGRDPATTANWPGAA